MYLSVITKIPQCATMGFISKSLDAKNNIQDITAVLQSNISQLK